MITKLVKQLLTEFYHLNVVKEINSISIKL